MNNGFNLTLSSGRALHFVHIELFYENIIFEDVFSQLKSKKLLHEVISSKKYMKLYDATHKYYSDYLNTPIHIFLAHLKANNDFFYKSFLNRYGDLTYSRFFIKDKKFNLYKGVYIFLLNKELVYVGRCMDNLNKRINYGYGKINSKNCYLDGQATNCHLNNLITRNMENIQFYVLNIVDKIEIMKLEHLIFSEYKPIWNISTPQFVTE